ncbi:MULTISPECIES: winged helix-turn-helix domain-containing protein [unclassified Streptomyces]|uniref:GntR family transcriptional regulator n=1 Tax=unclassified Streptomyces TaxID=2593676 RepID=UPI001369B269|nr:MULTISPECIES: winged helix-turn-helix domain-containing protein [unclassified Streptomyces]NEA05840.1 winged helix-turn-helix transcriptional regulator [Streptomyces sp. SID10116]MYY80865.1 GntR family transcriptional regulator [Streptomyces sp. SID335]MYZ13312.1 GntR family transcriptional regulator [Streptomyces sp. SID337]NDZ85677.1 winged helix-turn-helix transcriptional regulator [Streptomyces sp. SID10115]NEB49991.1 winged helix-turn-helix transcriptional regulator [Streptomyces sp. S
MSNEAVQPYQRIVQDFSEKIRLGRLTAGTKLPSTRELAAEYGIAPGTVQRALTELRAAGLIYSHQGRGSFVSGTVSDSDQDPTTRAIKALESQVAELSARLDKIEKGHDD